MHPMRSASSTFRRVHYRLKVTEWSVWMFSTLKEYRYFKLRYRALRAGS